MQMQLLPAAGYRCVADYALLMPQLETVTFHWHTEFYNVGKCITCYGLHPLRFCSSPSSFWHEFLRAYWVLRQISLKRVTWQLTTLMYPILQFCPVIFRSDSAINASICRIQGTEIIVRTLWNRWAHNQLLPENYFLSCIVSFFAVYYQDYPERSGR